MEFTVHRKEKIYLVAMTVISLILYGLLFLYRDTILHHTSMLSICGYIVTLVVFKLMGSLFLLGYLKGNAIKINQQQFPDIHGILESHAKKLDMQTPDMYLLQSNGALNAFATRLIRRDYVIVYSDILELAYQEGIDVVSFIIGHELGHIKRNHTGFFKAVFLSPARFVPLLGYAYSRACEYTCDNIGYNLCPAGGLKGALLLAAGKKLYKKINVEELVLNTRCESKFARGFAEIFSTHPALVKRVSVMHDLNLTQVMPEKLSFISPAVNTQQLNKNQELSQ